MSKVTEYIDNLFYLMPRTNAAAEMRQKLIESSEDKYEALLSWGRSEEEALGIVVGEFGSMEEICEELGVYPMGSGTSLNPAQQLHLEYARLRQKICDRTFKRDYPVCSGVVGMYLFLGSRLVRPAGSRVSVHTGRHRSNSDHLCLPYPMDATNGCSRWEFPSNRCKKQTADIGPEKRKK